MHLQVTWMVPHTNYYQWVITPQTNPRSTTLGRTSRRRVRSHLRLSLIGPSPQIQICRKFLLRFSTQGMQVPRTHWAQMSRAAWCQRFCSSHHLQPRIKTPSFHHFLQGRAATLFYAHSDVQFTATPPIMLWVRLLLSVGLPHPTSCKDHRLVHDSPMSLIPTCTKTINGPSTTCTSA